MKREEIYQYLIKNLTMDNLKEVTIKIIDAYKNKNIGLLQSYAGHIEIDHHDFADDSNRLFLKLIKYFHPDMLNYIQKDIENSFNKNQMHRLEFYKNLLSADKKIKTPGSAKSQRTPRDFDLKYSRNEEYQFDTRDFGYGVSGSYDETEDAIIDEMKKEFDFINALKAAYMGNNDLHLGIADLESIEEELVLCDYGISNLNGLQHCVNITNLNLSYNIISSIYEIKYLSDLRELFLSNNCISNIDYMENLSSLEIIDISCNKIENIDVLLSLENLKFADLRNNPLSPEPINALNKKKDLYVIF